MHGQEKFEKQLKQCQHQNKPFFERPHLSRRHFFQLAGAGVTASFLPGRLPASTIVTTSNAVTKNTAKNVIFVLLAGAPSHTDTFDLKMVNGVTPATFNPATINAARFPTALLPKLAQNFQNRD